MKKNGFTAVLRRVHGFTLLELLVTITIIGILASIGLGNYMRSIRRGKDSRRMADLKQLQNALEQYYTTEGSSYPVITDWAAAAADFFPENAVPTDPDGESYNYGSADEGNEYYVCTPEELEVTAGNASDEVGTPLAGGDFYCIWNLQ